MLAERGQPSNGAARAGAPLYQALRSRSRRDNPVTAFCARRPAVAIWHGACLRRGAGKEVPTMYSILYIIGAIVVIIVILRLLNLY